MEIGGRIDMPSPSPTKYELASIFDMKKKQGIKFGFGREVTSRSNSGTQVWWDISVGVYAWARHLQLF